MRYNYRYRGLALGAGPGGPTGRAVSRWLACLGVCHVGFFLFRFSLLFSPCAV